MPNAIEIGFEAVARPALIEGIENDYQAVVIGQALSVADSRRSDQFRIAVVHAGPDVQGILGINYVQLGKF